MVVRCRFESEGGVCEGGRLARDWGSAACICGFSSSNCALFPANLKGDLGDLGDLGVTGVFGLSTYWLASGAVEDSSSVSGCTFDLRAMSSLLFGTPCWLGTSLGLKQLTQPQSVGSELDCVGACSCPVPPGRQVL